MGTLINVLAIIVGGFTGLFGGSLVKEHVRDALFLATGVAVVFVGISGAIGEMLSVADGVVSMNGGMMMIGSLAVGTIIGEMIGIEDGITRFGEWLKQVSGNESDSEFVNGFVVASLTVCVGAMAIVGSIQDGILHDPTTLITKAILDFLIIMVMTVSMGKGCIFSCIPVGIFQGTITILARFVSGFMTDAAVSNLSLVGSVLIFCVGYNLIHPKTFKVANMLPAVLVAMIWSFFA